jgi:NmrA-like family
MRTGDTSNLASVAAALDDVYGAWVNIDGFTVGEQREIYAGMRIFELAKQTKSLRHYVWSSLDYDLKVSESNPVHLEAFRVLTVCCVDRGL